MSILLLIGVPLAFAAFEALAYRYGAEDRSGFDERRPLS